jgi:hypothetical protein
MKGASGVTNILILCVLLLRVLVWVNASVDRSRDAPGRELLDLLFPKSGVLSKQKSANERAAISEAKLAAHRSATSTQMRSDLAVEFERKVLHHERPQAASSADAAAFRSPRVELSDGSTYRLPNTKGMLLVGRDRNAQIRISDSSVSRSHALLLSSGSSWEIIDSGSLNGVAVNGVFVRRARLRNGDKVTLSSSVWLKFESHS